jgi:hypothetical protein
MKGGIEMKRFKILWKTTRYGDSYVTAKDEKEARKFAEAGTNGVDDFEESFEENDYLGDWLIDEIIEVDVE